MKVFLLAWSWNAFVLIGTSYLVFYKGISPWWFLLALATYKWVDNKS